MHESFTYVDGQLHAEQVPVSALAEEHGTPLFIYSGAQLVSRYQQLVAAMANVEPLICYSVKANSNRAVIRTFLDEGAGVDIVSGGELFRALRAGVDASKVVFAGVGKTRDEIEYALRENILLFTVESEPEVRRISECGERLGLTGRIAFRVNPDVDPKTHKYTTTGKKENKFGLDIDRVVAACKLAALLPNVEVAGLHMHIGSQILSADPFAESLGKVKALLAELREDHPGLKYLDIGGGIGIKYQPDQQPLTPEAFAASVLPGLKELGLRVIMEPGRFLVGNAGLLVARVQYVKDNPFRKFIVADVGMNDLIRPSLYQAYHEVLPVAESEDRMVADLVGPICESGDFVAQERELPVVAQDDLLAIKSAGAYSFSMSSNYNSRPRAAEIMVDGSTAKVIRERESLDDLVRGEA